MFTVALIGLDGVGKTTVARQIEAQFPGPLKYLYMGDNIASSNFTLPTTRWWKSRGASASHPPTAPASNGTGNGRARVRGGLRRSVRKSLGLVNRVLEGLYRESVAGYYRRRGIIVLLDRHFTLDYYHEDRGSPRTKRTPKRRLEGFFRRHLMRLPDLVICLDAPGAVAFERKGEFSPDFLEQRRKEYLSLGSELKSFEIVDATRPVEEVVGAVQGIVLEYGKSRRSP